MNDLIGCNSLKFSLKEKIITQCGFHGGILIGAYGLYLSQSYAITYLLFSYIGIGLLMRYTVCPRCPHLFDGNDCCQLQPQLAKIIVGKRNDRPMNIIEKSLWFVVLYGILIMPIYGLLSNTPYLVAFIAVYGGYLLYLKLHLCKNCQNKACMQNKNYLMR